MAWLVFLAFAAIGVAEMIGRGAHALGAHDGVARNAPTVIANAVAMPAGRAGIAIGNQMRIGTFHASLHGPYLKYYRQLDGLTNALEPQAPGIEVGGGTDGMPRVKAQLRLGWARGNWGANWAMRYTSAMIEDCAGAAGFAVCRDPYSTSPRFPDGANPVGAAVYNDVRVNWTLPIRTPVTLAGGVNNVFDHEAPLCLSCQLNGYDASNYPLPGRFWYVSAGVKF